MATKSRRRGSALASAIAGVNAYTALALDNIMDQNDQPTTIDVNRGDPPALVTLHNGDPLEDSDLIITEAAKSFDIAATDGASSVVIIGVTNHDVTVDNPEIVTQMDSYYNDNGGLNYDVDTVDPVVTFTIQG